MLKQQTTIRQIQSQARETFSSSKSTFPRGVCAKNTVLNAGSGIKSVLPTLTIYNTRN